MVEVVVLGVAGVLQPLESLWLAEIDAVARGLARPGFDPLRFAALALDRRRRGEPAALGRTARELGGLQGEPELRALLRAARLAVPEPVRPLPAGFVRALGAGRRLAILDTGPGSRLDAWLDRLAVSPLCERRLATDDLGGEARPPRALAFRWLASRLGVRAADCLYVPGREPLREAALRAGYRVWDRGSLDPRRVPDLGALQAELDAVRVPGRTARV